MYALILAPWPRIAIEICFLYFRFVLIQIRFLYLAMSAGKKCCKKKQYLVTLGTNRTVPSMFDYFKQLNKNLLHALF